MSTCTLSRRGSETPASPIRAIEGIVRSYQQDRISVRACTGVYDGKVDCRCRKVPERGAQHKGRMINVLRSYVVGNIDQAWIRADA